MQKETNISPDYISDQRKQLGQQIKAKRIEVKLSQQQLGDSAGLTSTTISKIESGIYNFGIDYYTKLGIVLNFKISI